MFNPWDYGKIPKKKKPCYLTDELYTSVVFLCVRPIITGNPTRSETKTVRPILSAVELFKY